MTTHNLPTFGLSKTDISVIRSIVNEYAGTNYTNAKAMLKKVFAQDITNEHYTMLGFLIGETVATDNSNQNLNHLFICQRQN